MKLKFLGPVHSYAKRFVFVVIENQPIWCVFYSHMHQNVGIDLFSLYILFS